MKLVKYNLSFPVQVVVTSRLNSETHSSLRILSNHSDKKDVERFLADAPTLDWAGGVHEVRGTSVLHRPEWNQDRTHGLRVQTRQPVKKASCLLGMMLFLFTGPAGFEPTTAGVKVLCLTAWRRPIIFMQYALIKENPCTSMHKDLQGGYWDSNPGPPEPQSGALTNCAIPTIWRAKRDSNPRQPA